MTGVGAGLEEAPRQRRTAYRSGRRELIGYHPDIPGRETKTKRRVSKGGKRKAGILTRTPFQGKFRWKKG